MLEVVWSYRPDDRSKQGTTESLPDDLAKMKVAEGLAVWPKPKPVAEPEPEKSSAKSEPAAVKVPKQGTSTS